MRTIYAIQLQVKPSNDGHANHCFAELVGRVRTWVEQKYQRAWATGITVPMDGQILIPTEGHSIRGVERTTGDSDWFTLDWTHPADSDPSTSWVSTCIVARHGEAVQLALLLRISTTRVVLRPVQFELGRPRLVTEILGGYQTSMDDWPIPTSVQHISSPDVQRFVDDVLLNRARNLPVVMVSPSVWNGTYAANASTLFDRLRGFAHVVVLADKWTAFKLTDAIEKPLSCYDGAIRMYWPGFSLSDNPFQHRLYLPHSIHSHEAEGLPLQDHLFRTLAAVASYRYTEGTVIRDVRRMLLDEERRKLDELRNQIRSGSIQKTNLETQLLEALEQIELISTERDQAKAALAAQQAAWAEVQQAMIPEDDSPDESQFQHSTTFGSVWEAVQKAKQDFSHSLVFLESAIDSARESPYKDPNRVYELFEALALVATDWKQNGGQLGSSWNQALEELGFDLRDQVSQTSKGKHADDYKFLYKGEKRLFERHITIGAKQADKCLSVHWYRDDDGLVLVIGHCGRHLVNTKS